MEIVLMIGLALLFGVLALVPKSKVASRIHVGLVAVAVGVLALNAVLDPETRYASLFLVIIGASGIMRWIQQRWPGASSDPNTT